MINKFYQDEKINVNNLYQEKYLKYKEKYIKLKIGGATHSRKKFIAKIETDYEILKKKVGTIKEQIYKLNSRYLEKKKYFKN